MRSTPIALLILVTAMPAVAYGQRETRAAAAVAAPAPIPDPCAALLSSEKIRTSLAALDGMLSDPPPPDLTTADAQEYQRHSEWLASVRDRLRAHLGDRDAAMSSQTDIPDAVQRMAALNMQFLALQNAVQNESRKFQTLSNASKARHDIAMNSIRNLKA